MRMLLAAGFILSFVAALGAQGQTGTIIFYREPMFATGNLRPMLSCDGVSLARVDNGTYFQITAPAGTHRCTTDSSKQPAIGVDVTAGETAYVHIGITGVKERAELANTTDAEYDKRKSSLKPVKEWLRDSLRNAAVGDETAAAPQPEPQTETAVTAGSEGESDETSWLHPSDAEYRYALDLGFEKIAPGKKQVRPLHFVSRPQADITSQIDVQPPLVCALNLGAFRKRRLDPEPTVEDVRLPCDGQLTVMLLYYSTVLNPDRPIVLDHAGSRVKPRSTTLDPNPQVARFDGGFLAGDETGYRYSDLHDFTPEAAWSDRVTLVTADELGKESSFVYDFGLLVKNEQQIRAQLVSAQ